MVGRSGSPVVPSRYIPRLQARWLGTSRTGESSHQQRSGTVVFADVHGFTALSERLARRGRAGAEELTELINAVVCRMLQVIRPYGGDLLEYGGDALLLLFSERGHERRAIRAAAAMQGALQEFRAVSSESGRFRLSMSIGVETGRLELFLAGIHHRELLVAGPTVSSVLELQRIAEPDEIIVGGRVAELVPSSWLGAPDRSGARSLRTRAIRASAGNEQPPPDVPESGSEEFALTGVPRALRAHLGAVDGEHRQAAVGFVQWRGLDELLLRAGPDSLARTLHELVEVTLASCADHGVTFLTADVGVSAVTLVLVAGAPTTSADNEDRMLSVLRTVVDTPAPLPVRAGVHRGRVFAFEVGDDQRRIYTVLGDTVNLAARMMAAAPDGGLLATSAVLDRLRVPYAWNAVDPLSVKGISDPVPAALVGPVAPTTATVQPTGLPFVGRQAELAVLLEAIRAARSGERRVVDIVGDPGMGKTRLLTEALAQTGDLPVVVIRARQYAKTEAYGAVRDPFRTLLGADADTDDAQVGQLLNRTVGERAPELRAVLPLVGVPFGLRLPDNEATAGLSAEHRRDELRTATIRLLLRLFPDQGVLAIEDPYWLDEGSKYLLAGLAGVLPGWAVLVAQRATAPGLDLSAIPDVERLELGPLPRGAMESLAAATGKLTAHDVSRLAARSGGNPLFLEELAAALAGGAAMDELPDTVEAVIAAHLDTLEPAERAFVRTVAVLGSDFSTGLAFELAEIHDPDVGRARVEGLAGVLESDNGTIRFTHALLRESAYAGLSFRRRRALHGRAGDLIRTGAVHPGDREHQAALLSLHYYAAHRHRDCWDWSLVAAERARHDAAPTEAVALFHRALESSRAAEVAVEQIADVYEQLGDAADLAGRYRTAVDAYRRARKLRADETLAVAGLVRKQGHIAEQEGRYPAALRLYTQGLRILDNAATSTSDTHVRAELNISYGVARLRQGRYADAIPVLENAARLAEKSGDRAALAHVYYLLDWAHTDLGQPDPRYRGLALPIYEELGDWLGQGNVLINLGVDAYYEGRWLDAVESYRRGRDAYERIGATVLGAAAMNNIGEILCDQGHFDDARAELEAALEIWTVSAYPGAGLAAANLGRVAARTGAFERAESLLADALTAVERIGADAVMVDVELRELERLVLMGSSTAALGLTKTVRSRAEQPVQQTFLDRMTGWAYAQEGDYDAARAAFYASLRTAQQINARYEEARTRAALARLATHRSGDVARDREAEAMLVELGVIWSPIPPLTHSR